MTQFLFSSSPRTGGPLEGTIVYSGELVIGY